MLTLAKSKSWMTGTFGHFPPKLYFAFRQPKIVSNSFISLVFADLNIIYIQLNLIYINPGKSRTFDFVLKIELA